MITGTFNGALKLFICDIGTTFIDVAELYSAWKEWVQSGQGINYLPAFEAIGGQPLPGGLFAGRTFFLLNDWKIRPQSANHQLNISGNLYTEDGSPVAVAVPGYTIQILQSTSAQAQGIATSGGAIDAELKTLIEEMHLLHGLASGSPLVVTDISRTAGSVTQAISSTPTQTTVTRQ